MLAPLPAFCYKDFVDQERVPRGMPERTGRHYCAGCLREIPAEEFLSGDHYCRDCAASADDYPLATTPGPTPPADPDDAAE